MKQIIALVLCIASLSCCSNGLSTPLVTNYYATKSGVSIERTTFRNRSEFIIKMNDEVIDELVWKYSEKNAYGLFTDTGTCNFMYITQDTIYVEGQGWHYVHFDQNHKVDRVIITEREAPNAYWKYYPDKDDYLHPTRYYDLLRLGRVPENSLLETIVLRMHPCIEVEHPNEHYDSSSIQIVSDSSFFKNNHLKILFYKLSNSLKY